MQKDGDRTPQSWLRYSHLGLQFSLTLVLCVLAGSWLDKRYETSPWWTLAGSLLGISASLYLVIKETSKEPRS